MCVCTYVHMFACVHVCVCVVSFICFRYSSGIFGQALFEVIINYVNQTWFLPTHCFGAVHTGVENPTL